MKKINFFIKKTTFLWKKYLFYKKISFFMKKSTFLQKIQIIL